MIHLKALLQLCRNSPVPLSGRLQRHFLHLVAQFHLHRSGLARRAPAVETGSAQAGHLTRCVHGLAFRGGLLDFFKQTSAPLTTAGG